MKMDDTFCVYIYFFYNINIVNRFKSTGIEIKIFLYLKNKSTFAKILENMKKTILAAVFLFAAQLGIAQEQSLEDQKPQVENKNMVKLNLLALTAGNISLQYERLITPKTTVGATVNMMPSKGLPFSSSVESFVDDQTTSAQLKQISISSFSVTPEIRFYLGKEGYKGFYIAPFVRYGKYNVDLPVNYDYEGKEENIMVDGEVKAFSGGFAIGAQWRVYKDFYLDWMIMGPHFGSAKGTLEGKRSLNQSEQDAIRKSLSDLDIPVVDFEYEVNDSGAKAKLDGPWAGIRASIGIGYRF